MSYPTKRTLAIALIGLTIGGCSAPTRWYLNGRSNADFQQIEAHCTSRAFAYANEPPPADNMYAAAGNFVAVFGGAVAAQIEFNKCMKSYGFTPAN